MQEEVDYEGEEGPPQPAAARLPAPQPQAPAPRGVKAPPPSTQQADDDEDGEIVDDDEAGPAAGAAPEAPPAKAGEAAAEETSQGGKGQRRDQGRKKLPQGLIKTHNDAVERLLALPSSDWSRALVQLKIILDARNREPMQLETLQKILQLTDEVLVALMFWSRFQGNPATIVDEGSLKKMFAVCSELCQEDRRRMLEQQAREETLHRERKEQEKKDRALGMTGVGASGSGAAGIGLNGRQPLQQPQAGGRGGREAPLDPERVELNLATECLRIKALPFGKFSQ